MKLQDFDFPLNVYAAVLEWEEGRVDYLHFGLFDAALDSAGLAQERASARLWAAMPPPCRVLEVGVGLGTTLQRLGERGYVATGITPDAAQIAAVRQRSGTALDVQNSTLQALQAHGDFDLLLLQESAQYIEPMALFEAADRLLNTEHASLLVMDEFALRRDSSADFGLHLLPHFKALAERFGWTLVHEEDLSEAARPTVDLLMRLIARHTQRLQSELGVSAQALEGLGQALQRYRDNYASGVFGYGLLRFERGARPAHRPVLLDAEWAPAVRAMFHRVFGREMGAAEWEWKYGEGRGHGAGLAARDGTMMAFYGALSRRVLMLGQPVDACQICDVMIEAGARVSLARKGAIQQVTATFVEAEVGWARRFPMGFGFPTDRALGVAERLGLYRRVDELVQLRWPAQAAPALAVQEIDLAALREDSEPGRGIQALWSAMAASMTDSVLGVRDCAWLRYRYGLKPGYEYTCLLVSETVKDTTRGLVVLRRQDDHVEVLDVLALPEHMPLMIQAARAWAARDTSLGHVKAWITRSHAQLFTRSDDGSEQDLLNIFIPANSYSAGVPPETLLNRWFLMAGDTDFR